MFWEKHRPPKDQREELFLAKAHTFMYTGENTVSVRNTVVKTTEANISVWGIVTQNPVNHCAKDACGAVEESKKWFKWSEIT